MGKDGFGLIPLAGAVFLLSCSTALLNSTQPGIRSPRQASSYKLVFDDEFSSLDLSPDGSGTHTWYDGVWFSHKHAPAANITVAASILSLKWQRGQGSADTSISTASPRKDHFIAWRYGYFEARMKWDVQKGAWPAFWLIPIQDATGHAVYNGVKRSGEIDIFEGIGDEPHSYYGTLHEWIDLKDHPTRNNRFRLSGGTRFSDFHTYGLLWAPGRVTWYLDNRPVHSETTPGIFDSQDFFLVLGMQEGEDWKLGDLSGVSACSMTLRVDWIRVWQQSPPQITLLGKSDSDRAAHS